MECSDNVPVVQDRKSFEEIEPVRSRRSRPVRGTMAWFASQHEELSVVARYAATNKASDDEKEEFYRALQSVTSDINRHDIAYFVGDFKTKFGDDPNIPPVYGLV
ncbi:hypothetical protein QYM36_008913 [Artemia franciscana]|uniref:Uncharacterized protein n=1 Tax=Artemia franciscana TaxID=6661 RepID=A0AA88HSU0_ARTSF|nr:hypothetical protein QYM36_008913 [Artemia franciscana]